MITGIIKDVSSLAVGSATIWRCLGSPPQGNLISAGPVAIVRSPSALAELIGQTPDLSSAFQIALLITDRLQSGLAEKYVGFARGNRTGLIRPGGR